MTKLPLSALVTSRDEGALLDRCLSAIAFCDELIVIDLESRDDTRAIAERHGARVVEHRVVPIAEEARVTVAPLARHATLLVVDPDELVPSALAAAVADLLPLSDDVAAVDAPRRYSFRGRPLRGTVWGGANKRRLIVQRDNVELTPAVWGGMIVHPGMRVIELPFTDATAIEHDWARSYRELVQRHRRYVRLEVRDRLANGEITGWRQLLATPARELYRSYVRDRGYLDGLDGALLSLFYAGFRTAAEAAFLRALRTARRA